jgi:hypothetical protein
MRLVGCVVQILNGSHILNGVQLSGSIALNPACDTRTP